MYEHFNEKFPERSADVDVFASCNAALRAILADYEEISTWLAVQDPSARRESDELERARDLSRELENEILNHLKKEDDIT